MRILKRHFLSLSFLLLAVSFLLGWWNSSRYAERHLLHLGPVTLDIFSSNSLLRVSLVRGGIGNFKIATRYRQPNPRGKMQIRPGEPSFRSTPPHVYEVTMGFWHPTFVFLLAGLVSVVWIEGRFRKRLRGTD
ncbi:MAG: hypothetical protein HKN23_06820 [Verrucomicrobiales bacterium]|nr:hypothetical protein [Verrucomicrobiales bacterium]